MSIVDHEEIISHEDERSNLDSHIEEVESSSSDLDESTSSSYSDESSYEEEILADLETSLADANENSYQEDVYPHQENINFDLRSAHVNIILTHRDEENMNLLDINVHIFIDEERDNYVLEYILNEPGQTHTTKIVQMRYGG